jgi:hypothetical protein
MVGPRLGKIWLVLFNKGNWNGEQFLTELGQICSNSTTTSNGVYGGTLVNAGENFQMLQRDMYSEWFSRTKGLIIPSRYGHC